MKLFHSVLAALAIAAVLTGCGGGSSATDETSGGGSTTLSAQAQLGRKIFADPSLSASGKQSCASCHDPNNGHAPTNSLAAQFGGPDLNLQGSRVAPGIRYLQTNTAFYFAADGTPTGGFFWDGRASSLAEQAKGPFLNPVEMANASTADVVTKLTATAYAQEFRAVFGQDIFSRPDDAFERMALAVQQYEIEDSHFHPYSSKYDAFLRGQTTLTAQEQRGLALFNSPTKGNCAACHPSAQSPDGKFPLFTDFTYDNLGLPRNMELGQNADPNYYDLGLCARGTPDVAQRGDLCGAFKVPSLRNVALRKALFHNGVFKNLRDAVTFYVQRDTNPEKWYPLKADGSVDKFNDLPPEYRKNVNTLEVPYNRPLGGTPALSDSEIEDVIAFLNTLTDGWSNTTGATSASGQ